MNNLFIFKNNDTFIFKNFMFNILEKKIKFIVLNKIIIYIYSSFVIQKIPNLKAT